MTTTYLQETKSNKLQLEHREKLYKLFAESPLPVDQLLTCLGLYMRSSNIAKILFLNELYQLIVNIPGVIVEFGTWWGQNLTVFENLRAIYEPFNQYRRIIGFDTFKGYPTISGNDKSSETIKVGGYAVSDDYLPYLQQLLDFHEKNNVLANVKKHSLIEGDVCQTVPKYFQEHPEIIVALAYFDMALYEPTKVCLNTILPHLVRGSVIMFDELNSCEYPGETIAFKEILRSEGFTLKKSQFMTDRTVAIRD